MNRPVDSVILLHGYAEGPTKAWFPWLHRLLEDRGIRIWVPQLPEPITPHYAKWMRATAKSAARWDERTVVIGHSIGGVLALRLLELTKGVRVRAMIGVGTPYAATVNVRAYTDFFDRRIDWPRLKAAAEDFVFIQSKNDPLVPHDHAFRYQEALGAKLVVTERDGHFTGKTAAAVIQALEKFLPPNK